MTEIHLLSCIPIVGVEVAWVFSHAKKEKNERNRFKKLYLLSFIPFVGVCVAWILSCVKVCKQTKKKYLGTHILATVAYLLVIAAGFFGVLELISNSLDGNLLIFSCLFVGYIAGTIMGFISCSLAQKLAQIYKNEQTAREWAQKEKLSR